MQKISDLKTTKDINQKLEEKAKVDIKLIEKAVNELISSGDIIYTDEDFDICAKEGMRIGSITPNSRWSIVKDLKGLPSHAQGGVDIKFGPKGFNFTREGVSFKAKFGLVLPHSL